MRIHNIQNKQVCPESNAQKLYGFPNIDQKSSFLSPINI